MKRGKMPIRYLLPPTMFDRIVVDVIDVYPVFLFASDLMLPETSLPDTRFPMLAPGFVHPGINMKQVLTALGKGGFYPIPAKGEGSIIGWQGPHAMEVIGE